MKREKLLIKNTFILTIGTVISKIATIIALPLYVSFLTKTEYGSYDLIITIVAMILPVVTFQIQLAAFRFLLENNDFKYQKSVISNCYLFVIISSLLTSCTIMFIFKTFSLTIRLLVSIYLILDCITQLTRQICRGYGENKKYVISSMIETFSNLFLILLFVVIFKFGLIGMLLSLILSLFLSILYLFMYFKLKQYLSFSYFDKKIMKQILFYSVPLIFNTVSWQIVNASDRLIISGIIGIEMNAIYAAANKIPSIYHLFYSTFNLAWQESASISNKDSDVSYYYSSVFNRLYKFLFSGLIVLISITPLLVKILLNDGYYSAIYQMPILYVALFLSSFSSFYGGIYIALKKTKQVGISSILAAVINLIINFLLIKKIGLFAASISTLVSFLFMTICRAIDVRNYVKIKYNFKNILLSIIVIPFFAITCYIDNIYFMLMSIVISIIIFIVSNKELIKFFLNKIKKSKDTL